MSTSTGTELLSEYRCPPLVIRAQLPLFLVTEFISSWVLLHAQEKEDDHFSILCPPLPFKIIFRFVLRQL